MRKNNLTKKEEAIVVELVEKAIEKEIAFEGEWIWIKPPDCCTHFWMREGFHKSVRESIGGKAHTDSCNYIEEVLWLGRLQEECDKYILKLGKPLEQLVAEGYEIPSIFENNPFGTSFEARELFYRDN